jgi:hypothetical protein
MCFKTLITLSLRMWWEQAHIFSFQNMRLTPTIVFTLNHTLISLQIEVSLLTKDPLSATLKSSTLINSHASSSKNQTLSNNSIAAILASMPPLHISVVSLA